MLLGLLQPKLQLRTQFPPSSCFVTLASMDGWLASSDSRAEKKPRTAVSEKPELDKAMVGKLLLLLSQLSLRHSLEIRELQSAVFRTVVISKDSPFVSEAQEATRIFTEKAKGAREQRNHKMLEDLGEPQYHSWAAMVKVAVSDGQATGEDAEVLKQHFNSVTAVSDLIDRVLIAKVKRCFDKKMNKIHFAVCPDMSPILDALLRTIGKAGGRIKRGTAPRSGNERELQDLVDKLSKIVGDV